MARLIDSEENGPVIVAREGKLVTFFELATHQHDSRRNFIENFLENLKWENDMESFDTVGTGLQDKLK